MPQTRSKLRGKKKPATPTKGRSLMVRMDEDAKAILARAAELRRVSVSDYVRTVTLAQARKEILAAEEGVIALTPEEQLAFWEALNQPPSLTPAQKKLGAMMRGEA